MKLAAWLIENKLPAAELARLCGVHPLTVYKWRSGQNVPRPAQLAALAKATRGAVTANDFVATLPAEQTEEGPMPRNPGFAEAQSPFAQQAEALGLNPAAITAAALKKAIGDEKARRWAEENAEAIAAHTRYVEEHGLPLAKYRMF
jgi:antitoxin CcdA